MDDQDVVEHISKLVAEEERLRRDTKGEPLGEAARRRMEEIEVRLDQCWDLLRRRHAREEFGLDPGIEQERSPAVVEHYRQ